MTKKQINTALFLALSLPILLATSGCGQDTPHPDNCVPSCGNRECGPNGCGGQCGPGCTGEETCNTQTGSCEIVSNPSAPVFLSLSSNNTAMTPEDELVVTAVLTDPDGVDDLIGGSLVDPNTGNTYGAFVTSASEGSYSITLSWGDVDRVDPVGEVKDTAGTELTLRALFYDQAGHSAQRDLIIRLWCGSGSVESLCPEGVCANLQNDSDHCAGCGRVCPGTCENGQCHEIGIVTGALETCQSVCSDFGLTCEATEGWYGTYGDDPGHSFDFPCNVVPTENHPAYDWISHSYTRCYCGGYAAPAPTSCSDECIAAEDGRCNDGGTGSEETIFCSLGTDCADCGAR